MLPLDSGPKLAVGQWIAWWSGLPVGSSSSGNFICCLIIDAIFIGLGRAYVYIYIYIYIFGGGWGGFEVII